MQGAVAIRGEGLYEGLDWCVSGCVAMNLLVRCAPQSRSVPFRQPRGVARAGLQRKYLMIMVQ